VAQEAVVSFTNTDSGIRYGSRVIALSPKSNAVECATLKDVVAALQVIRAAVEGGELDAQITQASERLREGFKE